MSRFHRTFMVEVLTPDGDRHEFEASMLVYPCSDGHVGILAGRAPLLSDIGAGRMIVQDPEGRKVEYYVAGGFVQVLENVVTMLADECVEPARIDPEAAWDEIQAARKIRWTTEEQRDRRDRRLDAARAKFRIVQKYRAKMRQGRNHPSDRE